MGGALHSKYRSCKNCFRKLYCASNFTLNMPFSTLVYQWPPATECWEDEKFKKAGGGGGEKVSWQGVMPCTALLYIRQQNILGCFQKAANNQTKLTKIYWHSGIIRTNTKRTISKIVSTLYLVLGIVMFRTFHYLLNKPYRKLFLPSSLVFSLKTFPLRISTSIVCQE